jgi:hypothetical protein
MFNLTDNDSFIRFNNVTILVGKRQHGASNEEV